MRGIAGKDHAAMDKFLHATTLESVERYPFEVELLMPEHTRDPWPHIFRPLLDRRIRIWIELQINPPDIVRLLVQQRGQAGVKPRGAPKTQTPRQERPT